MCLAIVYNCGLDNKFKDCTSELHPHYYIYIYPIDDIRLSRLTVNISQPFAYVRIYTDKAINQVQVNSQVISSRIND